jgi:hypothetical protein
MMKLKTIALASALAMSSTFALAPSWRRCGGSRPGIFRTGCERRVSYSRSWYNNCR